MTRSIFDPDGGETERSGSPMLGPDAANISHMPPDVVDGEVGEQERADETPESLPTDSAEAAQRLAHLAEQAPGAGEPLDEMPPPVGA